jgi:pimeloyl-ACP methyl ester carboxylesterase
MGGAAVQMVALSAPQLVRKLILAGTTASQPAPTETGQGIVWPRDMPPSEPFRVLSENVKTAKEAAYAIAFSLFYETENGRAAAKAYWNRIQERKVPDETLTLELLEHSKAKYQIESFGNWMTPNPLNSFERLGELGTKMPVLVMNGDNDVLIPTSRSWELYARIPGSQLIIYPWAGHGFIWQYAKEVARDISLFLDGPGKPTKL